MKNKSKKMKILLSLCASPLVLLPLIAASCGNKNNNDVDHSKKPEEKESQEKDNGNNDQDLKQNPEKEKKEEGNKDTKDPGQDKGDDNKEQNNGSSDSSSTPLPKNPGETEHNKDDEKKDKEPLQPDPSGDNKVKYGHWNILNFTGDLTKQEKKTKRIAYLAKQENFDVLGLTEVDNADGVKNIVDEMNKLSSSNMYAYIASEKLKGDKFGPNVAEHVAVIYNTKEMEPEAFSNGKIGYSYTQEFTINSNSEKAQYARPPYGIKFKYKLKPDVKLTFVFDHFDAPGVSRSNKKIGEKIKKGVGTFEYREGQQLVNVLDYFDSIDGPQSNIFFGGDTNIKHGKQSFVFSTLEGKYKSVFGDTDKFSTSLGTSKRFSEPYDKLFYKTDYKLEESGIFDIYKTKEDSKLVEELTKLGIEISQDEKIRNGSVLSDHTYVWAEFLIK
ncbi:MnuA family membrane nuclease [Mycoplasma sp. 3398]